jgi:hypothetical protein
MSGKWLENHNSIYHFAQTRKMVYRKAGANQNFQLDAINAAVDLFKGQPPDKSCQLPPFNFTRRMLVRYISIYAYTYIVSVGPS